LEIIFPCTDKNSGWRNLDVQEFSTVFEAGISRNILAYFLSDITFLKVYTLSGLKKIV